MGSRVPWRFFTGLVLVAWAAGLTFSAQAQVHAQTQAPSSALVELSPSEKAYLVAHNPVSLCVDPDWWPFEVIDEQGRHTGIAADLLQQVAQSTGMSLHLHLTRSWEETLRASQSGKCTLLSFLNQTPDRERWLIFSEPLLRDPNVLITRADHAPIADLADTRGKSIALPRGTAMMEKIQKDFPNLRVVGTESEPEALELVSSGQVDMTLRSLIVAAYTIKHHGWFNLKIAGQIPGYDNQLRVGIIKSELLLRNILNKGVATLTTQDRLRAVDRHVSLQVVTDVKKDYSLALIMLALFIAGAGGVLWWARKLGKQNQVLKGQSQSDSLTRLLNRDGLKQAVEQDFERAVRHGRPLAVAMIDIDHFKQVNDNDGHLVGDQVLAAFAQDLKQQGRQTDRVCRWGGEEFLIFCNETTLPQVRAFAERVLEAVRTTRFAHGRPLTASAGVAVLMQGDSLLDLIGRADQALYDAKRSGRDRVSDRSRAA